MKSPKTLQQDYVSQLCLGIFVLTTDMFIRNNYKQLVISIVFSAPTLENPKHNYFLMCFCGYNLFRIKFTEIQIGHELHLKYFVRTNLHIFIDLYVIVYLCGSLAERLGALQFVKGPIPNVKVSKCYY